MPNAGPLLIVANLGPPRLGVTSPLRPMTLPSGATTSARPSTSQAAKPGGQIRRTGEPVSVDTNETVVPTRTIRTGPTSAWPQPATAPFRSGLGGPATANDSGVAPCGTGYGVGPESRGVAQPASNATDWHSSARHSRLIAAILPLPRCDPARSP